MITRITVMIDVSVRKHLQTHPDILHPILTCPDFRIMNCLDTFMKRKITVMFRYSRCADVTTSC